MILNITIKISKFVLSSIFSICTHKFPISYENYVEHIKVMILETTVYVYERTCKHGALLSSEIFTRNENTRIVLVDVFCTENQTDL